MKRKLPTQTFSLFSFLKRKIQEKFSTQCFQELEEIQALLPHYKTSNSKLALWLKALTRKKDMAIPHKLRTFIYAIRWGNSHIRPRMGHAANHETSASCQSESHFLVYVSALFFGVLFVSGHLVSILAQINVVLLLKFFFH